MTTHRVSSQKIMFIVAAFTFAINMLCGEPFHRFSQFIADRFDADIDTNALITSGVRAAIWFGTFLLLLVVVESIARRGDP